MHWPDVSLRDELVTKALDEYDQAAGAMFVARVVQVRACVLAPPSVFYSYVATCVLLAHCPPRLRGPLHLAPSPPSPPGGAARLARRPAARGAPGCPKAGSASCYRGTLCPAPIYASRGPPLALELACRLLHHPPSLKSRVVVYLYELPYTRRTSVDDHVVRPSDHFLKRGRPLSLVEPSN